jgi:hypothetical protein
MRRGQTLRRSRGIVGRMTASGSRAILISVLTRISPPRKADCSTGPAVADRVSDPPVRRWLASWRLAIRLAGKAAQGADFPPVRCRVPSDEAEASFATGCAARPDRPPEATGKSGATRHAWSPTPRVVSRPDVSQPLNGRGASTGSRLEVNPSSAFGGMTRAGPRVRLDRGRSKGGYRYGAAAGLTAFPEGNSVGENVGFNAPLCSGRVQTSLVPGSRWARRPPLNSQAGFRGPSRFSPATHARLQSLTRFDRKCSERAIVFYAPKH